MITHRTDNHRRHTTVGGILLLLIAVLTASVAIAAEPRLVPFQARLTDGAGADLTGVYQITFVIYDAPTGGIALWSEVHPSASIIDGRLNVLLGSLADLDDPNGDDDPADAVQFDQARFVGIKVGADTNQEMVPRHQLVPAFHSASSTSSKGLVANHPDGTASLLGHDSLVPIGLIAPFFGNPASLPNNWRICDGSVVNDSASPLNGQTLPNMSGRVARGPTAGESYGILGGQDSASVTVPAHNHQYSFGIGSHTHSVLDVGTHQHQTTTMYDSSTKGLGVGKPAWGTGPNITKDLIAGAGWVGNVTHATVLTSPNGSHGHDTDSAGGANISQSTTTVSDVTQQIGTVPSYVALYYVIRIK